MHKLFFWTVLLFGGAVSSFAQFGPIQNLRYNDDFSYLNADSVKKTGTEKLKFIPLSKHGESTVSFGGEIREWYELRRNPNFGDLPPGQVDNPSGVLQQRLMLHADFRFSKRIRLFTQLNSTLEFGNPNPAIPEIIVDHLGLHQAFADINVGRGGHEKTGTLRIGRQEFDFGNGLIISSREGPNNRLPFDGVSFIKKHEKYDVQILAATPVIINPKVFDNTHTDEFIWGAYASLRKNRKSHLDLYYLGLYSERRAYNYIAGKQNRHTIGGRLWRRGKKIFYDAELMYQTGQFNDLTISAFNFTAEVRHIFNQTFWKPMIGIGASYITGDFDHSDNQLNTYDPLFPKPVYGLATPQGPSNIAHIRPTFGLQPADRLFVNFRWYWLSRTSNNDGTYTPGMTQVRPEPNVNSDEFAVGTQYGLDIFYIANTHLSFLSFLSYVNPGQYIKDTGAGKKVFFWALSIQYKF